MADGRLKVDIDIQGAREMEALLKQLGPDLSVKVGDQALRAAARKIVVAAKSKVKKRTGNLADAIGIKVLRKRQDETRVVLVGVENRKRYRDPTRKGGFDRPAQRAHLTEFGTVHAPAQPFLRPALDANVNAALDEIGKVLARGIDREARRLAGQLGTRRKR